MNNSQIISSLNAITETPFTKDSEDVVEKTLREINQYFKPESIEQNVIENTIRDLCFNGISHYHYDVIKLLIAYISVGSYS